MHKENTVRNKVKECLTKIAAFLVLFVGIGLLLSSLLESAVVEVLSNRYLLQNYTAAQIAGNTAQARFAGTVIDEDIEIQDLTSILQNVSDIEKEQVVGAIAIASVGLYQPIFNGATKASLIAGAGTMKNDQVMGQGNYCLAGHHMQDESLLFGPLLQVETGDWVQLTDKVELYTYEVTEIKIIHQNEVEVLEDTKMPAVTLITCDQTGVGTNYRYMVRGILIDISPMGEGQGSGDREQGEEEANEYLDVFLYQTTRKKTGSYLIWIWFIGVAAMAAVLVWTGNKILKSSEVGDQVK